MCPTGRNINKPEYNGSTGQITSSVRFMQPPGTLNSLRISTVDPSLFQS